MRKIEFRFVFKNGNDIKFRHMDLDDLLDSNFALEKMTEDIGGGDGLSEYHIEYELISKDRYTGFKDNNDVYIYEGDIVMIETSNLFAYQKQTTKQIIWAESSARFHAMPSSFHNLAEFLQYGDKGVEVIGNIHQNKELLEINK